jgi:hypothetical protein
MYQTSANYRSSVADPECLSRIPDPTFSIPDPNCLNPGSRIRIKEFKYFNPKKQIPVPDPDFLPIKDPGVKKAPDPGSGSETLTDTIP